eukprot:TRINITY_DN1640_c0_g1_i6.p1 TRINITY_DN1640_c0_g1~~TRINITY_DN1640_c0_g1_i6.p1  ORF type:complete len:708 (+),score=157.51 TRINITY_DN1640_c0_g1_i6:1394-3517(+)
MPPQHQRVISRQPHWRKLRECLLKSALRKPLLKEKRKNDLFVDCIGFAPVGSFMLSHFVSMKDGTMVRTPKKGDEDMLLRLSDDEKYLICGTHTIPLLRVDEMRKGQKTTSFHKRKQSDAINRSFSVLYDCDGKMQALDVITRTESDFEMWTSGIFHCVSLLRCEATELDYYCEEWKKLGQETITCNTLQALLCRFNLYAPWEDVMELFKSTDENKDDLLDYNDLICLLDKLRARSEIAQLFAQFSSNGTGLEFQDLSLFFLAKQRQTTLSRRGFENMLTSYKNEVFDPEKARVYDELNLPLPCYWIASSHNTYLIENQFSGDSSLEGYISCFKSGCKCVEIDIWDGDNNEPKVTHGRTLTSRIPFVDVVRVIRDYAFIKNRLPLIISLENHCSPPQQEKMAAYFKAYLGGMLATPIHVMEDSADVQYLHSPKELEGKILLKGTVIDNPAVSKKVTDSLSRITYLKSGGSTADLTSAKDTARPYEMISVSESDLPSLDPSLLLPYNERHLSRTYPKGSRIDSSNYDPDPAWSAGVQLVALNYQTPGKYMWVNRGKFRDNGCCGYVRKPYYMFPSSMRSPYPVTQNQLLLEVTVLSARHLPQPSKIAVDATVSLQICGAPGDTKEFTTHAIKSNGFNPGWNEKAAFRMAHHEEAVLLVQVCCKASTLAHYALPVSCIRPGYRIVPLLDTHEREVPLSTLFCRFDFSWV